MQGRPPQRAGSIQIWAFRGYFIIATLIIHILKECGYGTVLELSNA